MPILVFCNFQLYLIVQFDNWLYTEIVMSYKNSKRNEYSINKTVTKRILLLVL